MKTCIYFMLNYKKDTQMTTW